VHQLGLASPLVAKSSTSLNWLGKGGNVTSAAWQITLCDTIWRVSSRKACLQTAIFRLELVALHSGRLVERRSLAGELSLSHARQLQLVGDHCCR